MTILPFHAKRALNILYEEGFFELLKSVKEFVTVRFGTWIGHIMNNAYLTLKYRGSAPDPCKIIWVYPSEIDYMLRPNFKRRLGKDYGSFVIDGDWDKKQYDKEIEEGLMLFENYWIFKLAKQMFSPSKKVELTDEELEEEPDQIRSISSKEKELQQLYAKIQNQGYQPKRELKDCPWPIPAEYDEIRVNIGRNGEFIFDDGRHRLSIAKVLELDAVPVRVFVRHKQWQELRTDIWNNGLSEKHDEELRNHPDLQDMLD